MTTECNAESFLFQGLGRREVVARFDGGTITTDAGALQGTELAPAQCDTIRLKLLKIGARIRVTVRKVWVSLAESFPYRALFQRIYENLIRRSPLPLRC